jgi:hypothetical protein
MFFSHLAPASSVFKTRLQSQIFSFVRQARASGLENDWIDLISGKEVPQNRLEKIDELVVNVLSKSSVKDHDIDHATQPWAEHTSDFFTHRNIIRYEIPKATRENLRAEALKEAPQDEAARALYRQKISDLRHQLIRSHALNQTAPLVPPLRVDVNEKISLDAEVASRFNSLKTSNYHFNHYVKENPLMEQIYSNPSLGAEGPVTNSPSELLKLTHDIQDENPIVKDFVRVLQGFLQEIMTLEDQERNIASKSQSNPRSPFDPDWTLLQEKPYAKTLRDIFVATRKLSFPVQLQTEAIDSPALSHLATLLAALKKMQKISSLEALGSLKHVEALLIRIDQIQADKIELVNLKTGNVGTVYPEGQEQFEKHVVNMNWGWTGSSAKIPYL